jgi:uncharacterized protein (TIGR02145 family)
MYLNKGGNAMKRYSAVCMGVLFLGGMSVVPGKTVADECVINLDKGKENCGDIPEIEIREFTQALAGQKGTGRAVIKVTLDGSVYPDGYTEATFKVKYTEPRQGWTVNIGDSESNNGWKGDAGTQSNDAELQIFDDKMVVFGNDYRPEPELNPLLSYTLQEGRSNITLSVKDRFLGWTYKGRVGEHKSEFIYALNGEQDDEGQINYDIYAGFNRTIGSAGRNGTGVGKVIIELKPDKAEPEPVPTVTSLTGRVWMDRNLGASRVAISSTDTEAYGDLYQWGRLTDGHEKRTSETTADRSASDIPGHGNYIVISSSRGDWRITPNNNLWQGVAGINNPCPAGFRLPTKSEFEEEINSWVPKTTAGAFDSPLKLIVAGWRDSTGTIVAHYGAYWTSTVNGGGESWSLGVDDSFGIKMWIDPRINGISVRCIQALPEELELP